jgi:8-oxo-dGTP pyrophosphatase MutT (NUDIX family)
VEGADAKEPRSAATVIAARQADDHVEVLVLLRSSASRFLPGYVVFPGGAVDASDAELAARWFDGRGEASRACAIRELAEEAGLALTANGLVTVDGMDLSPVADAPPDPEALVEISHWVAPEDVPVRFDARFYALAAGAEPEPNPDGAEADRAWWADPRHLLSEYEQGRCDLYWPTLKTMQALAGCSSVEEVLSLHVPQVEYDEEEDQGGTARGEGGSG